MSNNIGALLASVLALEHLPPWPSNFVASDHNLSGIAPCCFVLFPSGVLSALFLRRTGDPAKLRLFLAAFPRRGSNSLCLAGKFQIALQSAGIEAAVFDCGAHGASDFVPVAAVSESAFGGQRLDINERAAKAALNRANLELTHSRGINQPRAAGCAKQMPSRGGVAP